MNKKGQALVEFVLILPIFILVLFAIVDFGMIINARSTLENNSLDIVEFVKNDKDVESLNKIYDDIDIEINEEIDYLKVILSKEIDIITPGLNRVFDDPYMVKVERYIYND